MCCVSELCVREKVVCTYVCCVHVVCTYMCVQRERMLDMCLLMYVRIVCEKERGCNGR